MPELSSGAADARPIIRHDGLELVLQSTRPDMSGKTDSDLWVATRPSVAADWSLPVNLAELNTDGFDGGTSISSDRETLYFFTNGRGGSGSVDLFSSTRSKEHC